MLGEPIEITITYQKKSDSKEQSINLSNEEYFENENEEISFDDSLPKYDHAYDYIGVPRRQLVYTRIHIRSTSDYLSIFESFWNDGENFLIETDFQWEGKRAREIIINSKVSETPPSFEIIKVRNIDGKTLPVFHVFDIEEESGTIEKKVFPIDK